MTKNITHELPENAPKMLARAKSDLSVARVGKISNDTMYETLCTLCQQAVEKSLKTLMIHNNVPFHHYHKIDEIIKEMEDHKIILPENIKASALSFVTIEGGLSFPFTTPINLGIIIPLSEYAGNRRYSLSDKPLNEQDYKNVLARCEKIVEWIKQQIQK